MLKTPAEWEFFQDWGANSGEYLAHGQAWSSQSSGFSWLRPSSFSLYSAFHWCITHPARNKRLQSHIRLEHSRAAQYDCSPFSPSIKYQPYRILNSSSQHFQTDIIWKLLSFRTTSSSSIIYWGIKHKHRNTTGRFHLSWTFVPGVLLLFRFLNSSSQRCGWAQRSLSCLCLILFLEPGKGATRLPGKGVSSRSSSFTYKMTICWLVGSAYITLKTQVEAMWFYHSGQAPVSRGGRKN